MKVRYSEGLANHADPESCGGGREAPIEASTGETGRPAIEPRNQEFGMPTEFHFSEGNTAHDVRCESCEDPARSETLRMSGSFLHRNWEISSASGAVCPDGAGKATGHNPAVNADEKSDASVLPEKSPNKGFITAEAMEGRGAAEGNTRKPPAPRTQSRTGASMGLDWCTRGRTPGSAGEVHGTSAPHHAFIAGWRAFMPCAAMWRQVWTG